MNEIKGYCKKKNIIRSIKIIIERDFAIRYGRKNLNCKNIYISKKMDLSEETISRSYRRMKDSKFYDKIFKKRLMA